MKKMRRKRKRASDKSRARHSKAYHRVMQHKVKYNLSAQHLRNFVLTTYSPEEAELVLRLVRKDFKKQGYFAHRLHGCAGCEDFIWLYNETMVCPNCNSLHVRYLFIFIFVLYLFDFCCNNVGTTLRVLRNKKSSIFHCCQD